jgi:hypothetical protein
MMKSAIGPEKYFINELFSGDASAVFAKFMRFSAYGKPQNEPAKARLYLDSGFRNC